MIIIINQILTIYPAQSKKNLKRQSAVLAVAGSCGAGAPPAKTVKGHKAIQIFTRSVMRKERIVPALKQTTNSKAI